MQLPDSGSYCRTGSMFPIASNSRRSERVWRAVYCSSDRFASDRSSDWSTPAGSLECHWHPSRVPRCRWASARRVCESIVRASSEQRDCSTSNSVDNASDRTHHKHRLPLLKKDRDKVDRELRVIEGREYERLQTNSSSVKLTI